MSTARDYFDAITKKPAKPKGPVTKLHFSVTAKELCWLAFPPDKPNYMTAPKREFVLKCGSCGQDAKCTSKHRDGGGNDYTLGCISAKNDKCTHKIPPHPQKYTRNDFEPFTEFYYLEFDLTNKTKDLPDKIVEINNGTNKYLSTRPMNEDELLDYFGNYLEHLRVQ